MPKGIWKSGRQRPNFKHGLCSTSEYRAWQTMRLRCSEPKNAAFPSYGGRGIRVCERWKDDFPAFLADMGMKPSAKHELDRIDNDRGYEPGNCRWATRRENDRNRRSSVFVEFRGERRLLIELCEQFGVSCDTATHRLRSGWSLEEALSTPVRPKARNGEAAARTAARAPRVTTSGAVGVDWIERRGRWRARASVAGARREFGFFDTIEEAVAARELGIAEALARANCGELELVEVAS